MCVYCTYVCTYVCVCAHCLLVCPVLAQYNQFTTLIHETLKAVESEHRAHLEHLGKMEEQTM